ncbi:MAG: alanine racemase [Cyclonatronaceae bacterium]
MLEKAYHSTRAVVHAENIMNNLRVLADKTRPDVKKMAVVKADAYGHGSVHIAQMTQEAVDWFGVASVEEGMELRDADITRPIMVFGVPGVHNAALYERYQLTAVVSHTGQFSMLHPGTRCHLAFDTGMGRLGFLPEQTAEVLDAIKKADHLFIEGIMSHFATSDEAGSPKAHHQLELFRSLRARFPEHLITHIANSGGILHYPDSHFDMVRHGISMYGYAPGSTELPELKPALSWEASVVQCRKISKGETVSYGARWSAPDDGYLLTIPVGYADGLPRQLSGKIRVSVNGVELPQTGIVTMDYIMAFSGEPVDINSSVVQVLDTVKNHAGKWAELAGTIPYEILCGISPKVKRLVEYGD